MCQSKVKEKCDITHVYNFKPLNRSGVYTVKQLEKCEGQ
jgi:hypothetical protein